MSDSEQSSQLEAARIDRAVAVAKGVIGALPILGPMCAEIIGSVIPQQRLDRIADVLKRLEERLGEIEQQRLQSSLATDPEAVDLLEEGMVQATRAVSDERRDQIAVLLHTTLTDEQLRHAEKRKLWSLLGSLSDVEVLILQSHGVRHSEDGATFWEKHEKSVYGPAVHMGSSQEELDRGAIYDGYRQHLRELGLLRPNFRRPRRGELPEFDEKTGMMKTSGHKLTQLGRLLLRFLGLHADP